MILALAEAVPADKFSWRPAPGARINGDAPWAKGTKR